MPILGCNNSWMLHFTSLFWFCFRAWMFSCCCRFKVNKIGSSAVLKKKREKKPIPMKDKQEIEMSLEFKTACISMSLPHLCQICPINNPMGKHWDACWFPTFVLRREKNMKEKGFILCIPITNYDRGFSTERERELFYQVTIEWSPCSLCVWLHSPNVTCNFSPYANEGTAALLSFPMLSSH